MSKLESLIELAEVLTQQNDFQEVLRLITQKAANLLNGEIALIMMINPQTRHTMKTIYKEGQNYADSSFHFVHTNISGWVIDNNASFVTPNLLKDSRFRKTLFKEISIKSVACVPFKAEGMIIGTLLLISLKQENLFSTDDIHFMEKFSAVVSPFLKNAQQLEQYFISPIPKDTLRNKYEVLGLLGKSDKFLELLHAIEAAARCDVRVLLEGKSGTGKELIAKAIHNCSARSDSKFIAIDCGAIPEHLIESELFGHVKGAFTGAATARKGLFEEADHGTLFMDEITNLPLDMQAKLLRALQEGEIRPLGSNATKQVDVRVITAASTPLRQLVNEKKFREDLFYRLLVYPVYVPSLQERQEDIPLLANHFLTFFAKQQAKDVESFHELLISFMKSHLWQGNIRELENFVERMVTLTPSNKKQINISFIPSEFKDELNSLNPQSGNTKPLNESLAECERQIIQQALIEHNWNQSQAARTLRISEQTIRYKMNKLGISRS